MHILVPAHAGGPNTRGLVPLRYRRATVDQDATEPDERETGAVTTTFDEDEIPDPAETVIEEAESESAAKSDPEPESESNSNSAPEPKSEPEPTPDPTPDSTPAAAADPESADSDSDPHSAVDDGSVDDLSGRVERGEITGADVRAAESGDGRESTPEIDEIDLSVDDLDAGGASSATSGGNAVDDAGPLAGSIGPEDDGSNERTSDKTDATDDEQPGMLGRIKRFFS